MSNKSKRTKPRTPKRIDAEAVSYRAVATPTYTPEYRRRLLALDKHREQIGGLRGSARQLLTAEHAAALIENELGRWVTPRTFGLIFEALRSTKPRNEAELQPHIRYVQRLEEASCKG